MHGLGANLTALGMEYNPPLMNPGNGCMGTAIAEGVSLMYVWVNTPTGDNSTANATWDAFGFWLTSAGSENAP